MDSVDDEPFALDHGDRSIRGIDTSSGSRAPSIAVYAWRPRSTSIALPGFGPSAQLTHDIGLLVYSKWFQGTRGQPLSGFKTTEHADRQRSGLGMGSPVETYRRPAGRARRTAALIFGVDVKKKIPGRTALGMLALATMLLAACGTPPAKDFGGSWHPVNRYRSAPTEIPLHQQYIFFAAPIDGTLKAMLTRWASDTHRTLHYELGYDVTLYTPVASIRTTDLEAAASRLSSIYAAQGVQVAAKPGEIVVRSTNPLSPPAPTASNDSAKPGNALP